MSAADLPQCNGKLLVPLPAGLVSIYRSKVLDDLVVHDGLLELASSSMSYPSSHREQIYEAQVLLFKHGARRHEHLLAAIRQLLDVLLDVQLVSKYSTSPFHAPCG